MSFFSLFYKKSKKVNESLPALNIIEAKNQIVDFDISKMSHFEVSEISYEEYENALTKERRQSVRHSSSNQQAIAA
jgi:hypothetical protein